MAGAVFIVQILAMGYFAGGQRGVNLPLGAVSMNAYSYKGLVSNELRAGRTWGCPQQSYLPFTATQVSGLTACRSSKQFSHFMRNVHFMLLHVVVPMVTHQVL